MIGFEDDINKIIGIFRKYLIDKDGNPLNLVVVGEECKNELESFLTKFAESIEDSYRESLDREPPEDFKGDLD